MARQADRWEIAELTGPGPGRPAQGHPTEPIAGFPPDLLCVLLALSAVSSSTSSLLLFCYYYYLLLLFYYSLSCKCIIFNSRLVHTMSIKCSRCFDFDWVKGWVCTLLTYCSKTNFKNVCSIFCTLHKKSMIFTWIHISAKHNFTEFFFYCQVTAITSSTFFVLYSQWNWK